MAKVKPPKQKEAPPPIPKFVPLKPDLALLNAPLGQKPKPAATEETSATSTGAQTSTTAPIVATPPAPTIQPKPPTEIKNEPQTAAEEEEDDDEYEYYEYDSDEEEEEEEAAPPPAPAPAPPKVYENLQISNFSSNFTVLIALYYGNDDRTKASRKKDQLLHNS